MNDRVLSRIGTVLTLGILATLVLAQGITYFGRIEVDGGDVQTLEYATIITLIVGSFVVMGGWLATRMPRHPVGWLLLAIGTAGTSVTAGTLLYNLTDSRLLQSFGAWLDGGIWHPTFAALGLLFLLFPTGEPPSPRWRWLGYALVACWTFLAVSGVFTTSSLLLEFFPEAEPIVPGPWSASLKSANDFVQFLVLFPLIFVAVATLVLRFFRSRGLERQQMKWLVAVVVLIAVVFPISVLGAGDGTYGAPLLGLIPTACAVAVLRYRLYDIDRIINRTLVYGSLTAVLAAVYAGLVIGLQELLQPLSGGSDLAVVMTTLTVAALFMPARRRVQIAVDRRFNRRQYDSARTVEAFGARLRENIDLDTLRYELLAVLDETMAPSRAGVWLRDRRAS